MMNMSVSVMSVSVCLRLCVCLSTIISLEQRPIFTPTFWALGLPMASAIALVSHASKILLWIILERIRVKTKMEIADEQAGFR